MASPKAEETDRQMQGDSAGTCAGAGNLEMSLLNGSKFGVDNSDR